jgi:hypothetical protein
VVSRYYQKLLLAETAVFQAPQITTNPFASCWAHYGPRKSGAAADLFGFRLYRRSGSTSGAASGASYTLIQRFKMFGDSAEAIQTITDLTFSLIFYRINDPQTYGTST